MRIGIDLRTVSRDRYGFGRLRNLVQALAHVAPDDAFVLFGAEGRWCERLLADPRFSAEAPDRRLHDLHRRGVSPLRRGAFRDLDAMHFPTAEVWHGKHCPTVVTVHDLAPLHFPQAYFGSAKQAERFHDHLAAIARCSDAIATVSDYTKTEIVEHLEVAPERVFVIAQGIEPRLARGLRALAEGERQALYDRLGIRPGHYVLYYGGLDKRKNVTALLEAFARLRDRYRLTVDDQRLVVVGESDETDLVRYPNLPSTADRLSIRMHLAMPGWVEDRELAILLAGAAVFAFPSALEGFGYPPLEAMSCGVPVVCSNAAALPETVGDAALLVAPNDADGWADALWRAICDDSVRDELRRRGLRRVQQFNWLDTARAFLELYRAVGR